jgi:very-short-patch-repair endonuclease
MRSDMTNAETKLWAILRAKHLDTWKFKRQVPVGPFIADFVCFSARLIIEADGSQHVDSVTDPQRTAWLESQGFTVLHFWNADILLRPDDIATHIHRVLTDHSPRSAAPSRPLPQAERERNTHDR